METPLKVAVIGAGGIGRNHCGQYQGYKGAQLLAVCDMDKERADAAAAQFGINAYYSVDDLLSNEDLDAVSVATAGIENGSHHYEPTMQCLKAGKHVLCEKPISNDIETSARNGENGGRRRCHVWHQSQSSFYARRGAFERNAKRWRIGRFVVAEYDVVD